MPPNRPSNEPAPGAPASAPNGRLGDITLSFDNGPTTAVTPHVLDVLARHGIRATFFVLGKHLQSPDTKALVRRAADEGHWIGNHTFHHATPLGRLSDPDVPAQEIGRTQECLGELAHPDRFFRPFGGGGQLGPHLLSAAARDHLLAGGYTCVLWNSIPRDWAEPEQWVQTALAQCRGLPWALTVLHDYDTGAMVHLERFIVQAREEGARFRQDFPPECVPIVRGRAVADLTPYVTPLAAPN